MKKVGSQFEENVTSGSISWMPFEDTTVALEMKLIIAMYWQFHNVSVNDSPPAEQIEKIEQLWIK